MASSGARSNPYPRKTPLHMSNNFSRGGGRGRLTEEEISNLVGLEHEIAGLEKEVAEIEEVKKARKVEQRNELDACKAELRGGKLNEAELALAQEYSRVRIEDIKVLLLGHIADDAERVSQAEDNEALRVREEQLTAAVRQAEHQHSAALSAYNTAREQRESAESAMRAVISSTAALQDSETTLNAHSAELEAQKLTTLRERAAALAALGDIKESAGKVITQGLASQGEVQSADAERHRMEARVNKLSNAVKVTYYARCTLPGVVVSPAQGSLRATEVTITTGKAPLAFSFHSVISPTDARNELAEMLNPACATTLPLPAASLLVFVSAGSGFAPVCGAGEIARQVCEGAFMRLQTRKVAVRACEVYGDVIRDVLKADAKSEVHGGKNIAVGEMGAAQLLAECRAHSAASVEAVADLVNKGEEQLRLRASQVPLETAQYLAVALTFESGPVVTLLFAPSVGARVEAPAHIMHSLAKMATDPKEAKTQMKRSIAGRLLAAHVVESAPVAVVAVPAEDGTGQSGMCSSYHLDGGKSLSWRRVVV